MDLLHRKKRMHLLRFSPRRPHRRRRCCLEALAVDDAGAGLVVLLLRAPEVLERRERSKNGTTDPDRVLALRGCHDLDLHARGSESSQLLLHTISDTREHRGTTRKDNVAVQITTDIEISLVDRVVTVPDV